MPGYKAGDFAVDMAAPGVTLKQTDQISLEVGIGKAAGTAISMGLFGIKYEPTATQTSLLVNEVRGLRKVLDKRVKIFEGRLVLCSLSKSVLGVFELSNLDSLFEIAPDRDAAFAA